MTDHIAAQQKPKNKDFFKKGEFIFKEGDLGNEMYIIQSGSVEVVKKIKGEEVVLASLHKKDFFGEMALFGDRRRSAGIRANEDTKMLVINKRILDSQLKAVPEWFVSITKSLVENLKEVNKSLKSRFPIGLNFSILKILRFLDSKYGSDSDKGRILPYDRAKEEIKSILSVSEDEITSHFRNLSFVNIIKVNDGNNEILIPNMKMLNSFLTYLRSKEKPGGVHAEEMRKLESDSKMLSFCERAYKLLTMKKV